MNEGRRLAAHQTYFFPYIGFYSVVSLADYYVYGDEFQFKKQGWMNRNRIIGEDGNVRYINVPVKKHSRETPTNQIEICYDQEWEKVIINLLGYYKKKAPYYNDVVDMLKEVFSKQYSSLADLAIACTDISFQRLGMNVNTYKMSELELDRDNCRSADEWGICFCKAFSKEGVDTYVNAPAGKEFYDTAKYTENGLNIEFIQNNLRPYDQGLDHFEEGLSIIDTMMFVPVDEIIDLIKDYKVL